MAGKTPFEFPSQESLDAEAFYQSWHEFIPQSQDVNNTAPEENKEDVAFEFSSQESLPLSEESYQFLIQDSKLPLIDQNTLEHHDFEISPSNEDNQKIAVSTVKQIGVLAASIQVPFNPNQSSSTHQVPSSLPASQNWPGKYEFTVSFNPPEKNTKGVSWTYSKVKDKLYVRKDQSCPINFSANDILTKDVVIRAMALYTSPEAVTEAVHRCYDHSVDEVRRGLVEAEHLIRCNSSRAEYEMDPYTHRHSVLVPFENPPAGQRFSTYIYKFSCFGSCSGGPNRRPLMIVFTLERNKIILGRQKFFVKICACPGRDRKTEESLLSSAKSSFKQKDTSDYEILSNTVKHTKYIAHPPTKKAKVLPSKGGYFSISVKDPECFDFLIKMKKYYEIHKMMKSHKKALAHHP